MNNKKSTKRALLSSVLSLVLCVTMLIGTTFAWFTDAATSKNNKIVAGNLDVQLLMHNGTEYADISNTEASIFGASDSVIAQNKNANTLWEPGKTQVAYLAIKNNGNLALKYQVTLTVKNPEGGKNLYKAMQYVISPDKQNGEITSWDGTGAKTPVLGTQVVSNGEGQLQKGEKHYFALSVHMMEEAGNEYQGGQIDFDLTVLATQLSSEEDSFGPEYDVNAEYPVWLGEVDSEWEGTGTEADPYVLGSEAELAALAQAVNGTTKARAAANDYYKQYFKLTDDVDLENMNWTPIGSSSTPFRGHFDGGNHTVSNLLIDSQASYIGLFGYTKDGSVSNLTVNNATIIGRLGVGVISGCPYTSDFSNITLTGDIKVDAAFYVGGVVGRNAYGDLTNIIVDANEGSYVKANSVEDGTAYRTYVGGIVGFMGEGSQKVENVTSNIDVIGSTVDVGGIAGIAHYGNSFINCSSSGDVTITDKGDAGDNLEIGGIAGVWHNGGSDVTFTNCSYTGTLTSPGVTTFPYNGLVGKAYNATGEGVIIIDGEEFVSIDGEQFISAEKSETLQTALEKGKNVALVADVETEAVASAPYGNKVGFVQKGGVLDGNGNTLSVECYGDDYGIMTYGGTIKNLTIDSGCRAIVLYAPTEDVILDNVHVCGDILYPINTAEHPTVEGIDLIVSNSSFGGWSSFAGVESANFTNCEFTYGNYGYDWPYGCLVKPYVNTVFENCDFANGYYIDLSALEAGCTVTLKNCTLGDVDLTAENFADYLVSEKDYNEGDAKLIVEKTDGRYMSAADSLDYLIVK